MDCLVLSVRDIAATNTENINNRSGVTDRFEKLRRLQTALVGSM